MNPAIHPHILLQNSAGALKLSLSFLQTVFAPQVSNLVIFKAKRLIVIRALDLDLSLGDHLADIRTRFSESHTFNEDLKTIKGDGLLVSRVSLAKAGFSDHEQFCCVHSDAAPGYLAITPIDPQELIPADIKNALGN